MSDHEKHQIDLNNNAANAENANVNPPLMDYMQPKSKNNVILVGIACTVLVLLVATTGYYIYGYFKRANQPKSSLFNSPASVEVDNEDDQGHLVSAPTIDDKPLENTSTGTTLNPGYLSPEKDDYEGILISPEEIKNYNDNKTPVKGSSTQVGYPTATTTNPTASKTPTAPITPKAISEPVPGDSYGINWTANDYQKGDITGSSHMVIKGDTLWEISEGKYGEGKEWVKIKTANEAAVGTLRNGNPLIIPGQSLSLPN
jgi:hypothetical protein